MKKEKTFELVLTALFTAIIIIMAYTPLGFINLGIINATIIHIPVILGALFLGPKKGAFLGFVFGLTSFLKNTLTPATASAFVFSPVIAANTMGAEGALKSTFICFVPRILVGVTPFFAYLLVKRLMKGKTGTGVALAVAGFVGAFTNTILVMGGIYFLYKEAYAVALDKPASAVLDVIMGVITFNGVIEAALAAVIVAGVGAALTAVKPIYSIAGSSPSV